MDVLSDVLGLLRLKASVFFHSSFCGSWTVDSSGSGKTTFHMISRGSCWLHVPGRGPVALRGGDLIVFPRDAPHVINDTIEVPEHHEKGVFQSGEQGPSTSIVCGYFEFGSTLINPVLDALPDVVHIRSEDSANAGWLDTLMRFIGTETESDEPGVKAVVDKLSDVLFIQVVRTWMRDSGTRHGFLAALADPNVSHALQAVHQRPGDHWSVESLAGQAGMSRSAFAKRFQQLMEMAPMHYLARWRMQRAYELLLTNGRSVAAIAEQSGYQTEASFRKAFKQHMGVGPGAARKRRTHE